MATEDLSVEVMYSDKVGDVYRTERVAMRELGTLTTTGVLFIIISVETTSDDPRKQKQIGSDWFKRVSDSPTPDSAIGYGFDNYVISREVVGAETRYWLYGWDDGVMRYRVEGDAGSAVRVSAPPVMPSGVVFTGAMLPQEDWESAKAQYATEMF